MEKLKTMSLVKIIYNSIKIKLTRLHQMKTIINNLTKFFYNKLNSHYIYANKIVIIVF